MMRRVCLGLMRFCLCAWVGIATFFVMVVIDLRQSDLFVEDVKFNHPRVLFPLYYGFELPLLGTGVACAAVSLGNECIGRARRYALLQLAVAAMAFALWDYGIVYQQLLEMMDTQPLPARFHTLHHASRWLNMVVMSVTATAAVVALWPEKPVTSEES